MGNNADLLERILANTYTTSEVYKRLLVLEDMLQHSLFEKEGGGIDREQRLYNKYQTASERASAEAVAAWGKEFFDAFNKENLHVEMQALKSSIEEVPRLVLYAPVSFETKHIEEIGSWCRKNIDGRLLLDLRIDPQSAGGCMFVWHDTLHDFSLHYFLKKREFEFKKLIAERGVTPSRTDARTSAR